jgi:hypothetical protein
MAREQIHFRTDKEWIVAGIAGFYFDEMNLHHKIVRAVGSRFSVGSI